jgi:hypothetical protein
MDIIHSDNDIYRLDKQYSCKQLRDAPNISLSRITSGNMSQCTPKGRNKISAYNCFGLEETIVVLFAISVFLPVCTRDLNGPSHSSGGQSPASHCGGPCFSRRSGLVGFVVHILALGQVLSVYFGFSCLFSFHRLLRIH